MWILWKRVDFRLPANRPGRKCRIHEWHVETWPAHIWNIWNEVTVMVRLNLSSKRSDIFNLVRTWTVNHHLTPAALWTVLASFSWLVRLWVILRQPSQSRPLRGSNLMWFDCFVSPFFKNESCLVESWHDNNFHTGKDHALTLDIAFVLLCDEVEVRSGCLGWETFRWFNIRTFKVTFNSGGKRPDNKRSMTVSGRLQTYRLTLPSMEPHFQR